MYDDKGESRTNNFGEADWMFVWEIYILVLNIKIEERESYKNRGQATGEG